jgi:AcrR family transcriptional regulator
MGTKERREREKEGTRRSIMDAARKLFVEQGYEAVSMRKIADAIEYSPAAVYVHFADKESLIREMVREDFHRLDEEAFRLVKIADPVERIRQIGHGYVKFGVANPHHYRLMFMTPPPVKLQVTPEDQAYFEDPSKSGYAMLRQAVKEAMEQGRFRPEAGTDAELIAQLLWAGVHGVTSLRIAMRNDPCVEFHDPEGLTALMVETVLRGLVKGG